jgi:hypothetical protein
MEVAIELAPAEIVTFEAALEPGTQGFVARVQLGELTIIV